MSNGLGPDQDQHSVGPDLGPNCMQRLSAAVKSHDSNERFKLLLFVAYCKYWTGPCGMCYLISCGKCSKISNPFLFLLSNKMLVIKAGIHKILGSIPNREYPDQTASSDLDLHFFLGLFGR